MYYMAKKVVVKRMAADDSSLFIPSGLFFGLGFGAISGNWAAGVLFGLAIGFLGTAVVRAWKHR